MWRRFKGQSQSSERGASGDAENPEGEKVSSIKEHDETISENKHGLSDNSKSPKDNSKKGRRDLNMDNSVHTTSKSNDTSTSKKSFWRARMNSSPVLKQSEDHNTVFSEAKNCFLKGQQHQDEMGIKQWITWCDEKMEKLGIKYEKEEQSVAAKEITKQVKEGLSLSMAQDTKEPQSEEKGNKSVACDSSSEQLQMPIPKIKHDWYQTETQVNTKK